MNQSASPPALQLPLIRCPHGHTGPFRYLEDITVYREVVLSTPAHVHIDSFYQSGEGYDASGRNPRLECHHETGPTTECCAKFPLPPRALLKFFVP